MEWNGKEPNLPPPLTATLPHFVVEVVRVVVVVVVIVVVVVVVVVRAVNGVAMRVQEH